MVLLAIEIIIYANRPEEVLFYVSTAHNSSRFHVRVANRCQRICEHHLGCKPYEFSGEPADESNAEHGRPEAGVVRHGHIRFKRRDDGYDLFVYYLQYRRHRVANARPARQPHRRTYPRRSLGGSDYERTCRLGIFRLAV